MVGGYSRELGRADRLNSTEILSIETMTWSDGPDYPYQVYGNKGVTSDQNDYLGYIVGGAGNPNGGYRYQNEIMGLQKSNGRLEWVSVGDMTSPRAYHSAIRVSVSLIPSC